MWAAYLCSASIALAVVVAWYLETARAAMGWNVGAVGLSMLLLVSDDASACGAMVADGDVRCCKSWICLIGGSFVILSVFVWS